MDDSITFRIPAFWRLLSQVWQLTKKNCPDAFPISYLNDREWDTEPEHLKQLHMMICEMNIGGRPRAEFFTTDEKVLADMVMALVRAFTGMPELLPKLQLMFAMQTVGTAFLGVTGDKSQYCINRNEEMMRLAQSFHNMAKIIVGKDVNAHTNLICDCAEQSTNNYLTFSINY
jgi:hypothetical protein